MKCISFVYIALMLGIALTVSACSHKKLIVKNCDKAGNAELWICDPV